MRFALLPAFLLLAGLARGLAQEQEKGLLQRIEEARPDSPKVFDLRQSSFSGGRSVDTKEATTKNFHYEQKVRSKEYNTRGFAGSKGAWMGDVKFSTKEAETKGRFLIPNVGKKAESKTAATKTAREADRTLTVRGLPDGTRQFLGRESRKAKAVMDPKDLANWRSAGETITYSGTSVEKAGSLKELSIDDVREILNKNK